MFMHGIPKTSLPFQRKIPRKILIASRARLRTRSFASDFYSFPERERDLFTLKTLGGSTHEVS